MFAFLSGCYILPLVVTESLSIDLIWTLKSLFLRLISSHLTLEIWIFLPSSWYYDAIVHILLSSSLNLYKNESLLYLQQVYWDSQWQFCIPLMSTVFSQYTVCCARSHWTSAQIHQTLPSWIVIKGLISIDSCLLGIHWASSAHLSFPLIQTDHKRAIRAILSSR